jgi:hypothetical protein
MADLTDFIVCFSTLGTATEGVTERGNHRLQDQVAAGWKGNHTDGFYRREQAALRSYR